MGKGEKLKNPKECCSARDVLWYLVFIGFAVNYMVRINLNIAIVSMVATRPKNNRISGNETLFQLNSKVPGDRTVATPPSLDAFLKFESRKFDWDEKQQGSILGSFFYLHWITQIPGGLLANRYGAKLVYGFSNYAGVLLCFFIPFCSYKGTAYLIGLRMLQGFLTGCAWPSMHSMTARWIPPNERSKFVTAYLGSSVGAALTYPICGFIIDRWGWELVFYVSGVMGTLWFLAWWALVYDSPVDHPRISDKEKEYIVASLGKSVAGVKQQAPVPWLKMTTNVTVLMNILAQWGGVWGLFTLMTHAPTYFKFIHGWNIRATGLLSGMPHLIRMLWAFLFSQLGDYLLRSNKMTRSNVRKLATAVCCIVQGVFMLGLAYSGCDYNAAIIFLTLAVASHGAVSTGPLASIVDISPNYASVILGFCNTIVALVGFLTPMVVGQLTFQNQTSGQWQKVFWIAAGFLFVSGISYVLFAKSELQSWNTPGKADEVPESEVMMKNNRDKEEESKVTLMYADVKEK
ncbi:hypothetical protein NQ315_006402 [Exocentrus adspersus]|uniref:Major facilitator superfamily (MFS) profile domain-containing protein n=1 Tax=Exocentrus adspersus TaxID=1586481 RepID=A0AAV8VZU5_9CUCU|nr:hypothetical protein NQ315_006402 [Exocentrus adspersus]